MAEKQVKKQVAEQTQGAVNATGTEPPPSGGSAGVASKSSTVEPAGGLETPARDGVVPARPDAGVTATGEVSQSAAIKEFKEKSDALLAEMKRITDANALLILEPGSPDFDAVFKKKMKLHDAHKAALDQLDALEITPSTTLTETTVKETPAEIQPTVAESGPFVRKQMEAQAPTTPTPFSTKGTPASVTTPTETKQAKPQKQQAPAATGRKDVHTVAQGAEGKWDHTVNGEVVNSYDTKRQATAASLLAKAQKAGDPANIAQRQKAFDDAMNPNPRGKPPMLMVNGEFEKPKTETTEVVEGEKAPVVYEKGAYVPPDKKGGEPKATAGFKVLDEDNNLSEDLAGATLITGMDTTEKGQGTGSKLLKAVTDWADANGKRLALVPAASSDGGRGLSQEQLKAWYARNGFEDRIDYMVREPAGKEPKTEPKTETTEVVEGEQEPTKTGFRGLTADEQKIGWLKPISTGGVFDLGNGAKVHFDGNQDAYIVSAGNKSEDGVIRPGDTRGGTINKPSDFPDYVPENVRQPLIDYQKASKDVYGAKNSNQDTTKLEAVRDAAKAKLESAATQKAEPATETKAKAPSAADALAAETKEKLQELEDLLGNYNTNPDQFSARTSAKNIARMAKDPAQPKEVRERAKEILADEIDSKDLSSKANSAPPDTAFSKFTTAAQAISHILRTGTKFEKALASRLRGFVQGVKFVVVEKDQPLPEGLAKRTEQWGKSIAMYVESKGERTIYVRGDSFGTSHGISNEPVLHELLHAATAKKINLAMKAIKEGANLDSPLVQAALALQRTMQNADTSLNELARKGEMSQELEHLAKAGKAFTDLNEFVSYGITNKAMQDHLINTVGIETDTHLFTRFVDSIRRMFGMGLDNVNALSDLILATDQLLRAREIGTTEEVGTFSATGPKDDQTELNERVDKALKKAALSRDGEKLGSAVDNLASYRDPRYMWGEVEGVWDTLTDPVKSGISRFYDSEALAYAGPGDVITGLKDAHEAIQKMSGSVQTYLRGTANVADEIVDFYRAEPKKREAFAELLNASTDARYDPANPNNALRNKPLDDDYANLGKQGQAAYVRLRDYYKTMNAVKQHLIEENLDSLELPEEARKKLLSDVRVMFEADKIEPYFPLARFGDFTLEIGKENDPNKQKYRFDTKSERDRAARGHAAKQGTTVSALKEDGDLRTSEDINGNNLRTDIEAASDLLKKAYAAIDGASVTDPYLKQNLKDNLYQAYLGAMPENSVRKKFIHRKGTAGYSSDVLRALNDSGSKMARAFAKLEHGNDIRRATALAERQLVGNDKYTVFVKRMQEIADEALQPKISHDILQWGDKVANTIVKVSFIRNLTSMSSALMQPMDIVLKGAPVLTGNHGPKAMVELSKMMKLHNQYVVWEKMPNGTTRFRAPSIEFAKGLTPQERKAVRDMVDVYGVTRDTLANEVFSKARTSAVKVHSKAYEAGKGAVDALVLGGLMHHAERLSREVIALTSFRLHLAELEKANPGNPTNYDEAVKAAIRETNEVLGNYNANNKPMIMRGGVGRIVTMYKFFPLLTTKLLVVNFFKMIPGLNKQGKAAAATKFFGVLGTHAMFGGLVALPAFNIVMGLLQAAWEKWQKDPDAPDEMRDIDYPTWWRTEWLPTYFGNPELARLVEYGVLNKLTGLDISIRLSLNDMWFRDPQPGRTARETALNWGLVAGGAALSTGMGIIDGVDLMTQGEYERGLEKLMPASISKFMLARRYAEEGVQTPDGVQLVKKGKLPTSELIGQAVGYAPARVAEAREIIFKEKAAEKVIVREREKIMGTLKDSFRKSVDPSRSVEIHERFDKKFQDTLDKTIDFSLRHPEHEFKDKEIDKALDEELKRVIETEIGSGIRMTEKNIRLATPSIDKAENALAPYK
jgi:GNAT superfamily N-acetyltransferase